MQNNKESVLTFILTYWVTSVVFSVSHLCFAALETLILPTSVDLTQFC
jgi:hypothetical protein